MYLESSVIVLDRKKSFLPLNIGSSSSFLPGLKNRYFSSLNYQNIGPNMADDMEVANERGNSTKSQIEEAYEHQVITTTLLLWLVGTVMAQGGLTTWRWILTASAVGESLIPGDGGSELMNRRLRPPSFR